jgi:cell division transport system ATP-binding protein
LIHFENVGLRYGMGPEILRDLTFDIPEEILPVPDRPSGAGKTTLLRLLFLSLQPTRGLIRMFGRNISIFRARSCRCCAGASASSSRISACSTI